jgi:ELWxxDGT repeat protein
MYNSAREGNRTRSATVCRARAAAPPAAEALERRTLMAVSTPVGLATDIASFDSSALAVGNTLFFVKRTAAAGSELWKSDGTVAGTAMVKDILPGPGSPTILHMANFGGRLFFAANDGQGGGALYKSDGTAAGTVPVARFQDTVGDLAVVNGRLFFTAFTTQFGEELYSTDGTTAGTTMVTDLSSGSKSSSWGGLFDFKGVGYAMAHDADLALGLELYRTDGTAAGTRLVKDIDPGSRNGYPIGFKVAGGRLYFSAVDATAGAELWTTDGTAAGTTRVKDFVPGSASSNVFPEQVIGTTLYTTTRTDGAPPQLWKVDGPTGTATFVKNLSHANGDVTRLNQANGKLVFVGRDAARGREWWISNGTAAGTALLKDINPGAADSQPSYGAAQVVGAHGHVFFSATDGVGGLEPWATDGTAAGTARVGDLAPGSGASWPDLFRPAANGKVFFVTDDPGSLGKLWVVNVTAPAGSIAGNLFNDADGDAVRDAGEGGLANWKVFVDADKDGVHDAGERAATTDAAGNYSFTALPAGTYRVRAVQPSGWRRTTSAAYYDLALASGTASTARNFGFTQRALISGSVFNDADGNRVRGASETGLSAWRVFIDADGDGRLDTGERSVLSDASGNWAFKALLAGTYKVRVVQQAGWTRTTPTAGYFAVTLASGATATARHFGERRTA